jgi:hypothetical protein
MHRLVASLLPFLLATTIPDVSADPGLSGPPAADTIPFDDHDEAATQVELAQEVLTFLLTMQSYGDANEAALRETMTGDLVRDNHGTLIYGRTLADHGVLEGYEFRDSKLVRGEYRVSQRPVNRLNEFIDYYTAVKTALTDTFGPPAEDHTVWENDLYQPLPDYWGVAVMIGYLRYAATWERDDATITVALTGDRHSTLTIEYRTRSFRDSEQTARIAPLASPLETFDSFCHSTVSRNPTSRCCSV